MANPIDETVNDIFTYPVLTEDVETSGGSARTAVAGNGSLSHTAELLFRQALGWRPRTNDPKGFLAALTQSFSRKASEWYTDWAWTPRGYAVQADLGAVTGAQASIYQRAKVTLEQTTPLLNGLMPLRSDFDSEDKEAMRSIIAAAMDDLVGELGVVGGPRLQKVDLLFELLLGPVIGLKKPEDVGGQLKVLAERFGLERKRVNTIEEEQNLTNFLMLVDYVNALRQTWESQKDFFRRQSNTVEPFLGTQLVQVSRSLAVVAESVHESYDAMNSVFLGAEERQTTLLDFFAVLGDDYANEAPLTVSELLNWVEVFAAEQGPRMIQDAGKDGVVAFREIVARLFFLAKGAEDISKKPNHNPVRGFHTSRVQRSLEEVRSNLKATLDLSVPIKRDAYPIVISKPLAIKIMTPVRGARATEVAVTITGAGIQSGATVDFGAGIGVSPTTSVSADGTALTTTIFISSTAAIGLRNVTINNPDGRSVTKAGSVKDGFEVVDVPPVPLDLLNISVEEGQRGEELEMWLTGTGFANDAVVSFEDGTDISVTRYIQRSANLIQVEIRIEADADIDVYDVTVTNPTANTSDTLEDVFEVVDEGEVVVDVRPIVKNIDVIAGEPVAGHDVAFVLIGENFTKASHVVIENVDDDDVDATFDSPEKLTVTATLPTSMTTGDYEVNVFNGELENEEEVTLHVTGGGIVE